MQTFFVASDEGEWFSHKKHKRLKKVGEGGMRQGRELGIRN